MHIYIYIQRKKHYRWHTDTYIHLIWRERKCCFAHIMHTNRKVKNQSCLQNVPTVLYTLLSCMYICTSLYGNMVIRCIDMRVSKCPHIGVILTYCQLIHWQKRKKTLYFGKDKQTKRRRDLKPCFLSSFHVIHH
jgi:hypothetical protein